MHTSHCTILNHLPQKFITLAEVKQYLRIDHKNEDEEDRLIEKMIASAIMSAENYLNRCLIIKEIRQVEYNFYGNNIKLRHMPVIDITQLFLWDRFESKKLLDKSFYRFDREIGEIELTTTFISRGIGVVYCCGYEDLEQIPAPIKLGILNHIAALYDDRHLAVLPPASISLYAPYRQPRLFN